MCFEILLGDIGKFVHDLFKAKTVNLIENRDCIQSIVTKKSNRALRGRGRLNSTPPNRVKHAPPASKILFTIIITIQVWQVPFRIFYQASSVIFDARMSNLFFLSTKEQPTPAPREIGSIKIYHTDPRVRKALTSLIPGLSFYP